MFNFFEPNRIFAITSKATKYIFFIFILVLSIGLLEALVLSPEDYVQSHSVRIMYVHVPAAWISIGIFSIIGILSFGVLLLKNKNFSLIAKSLAPSGLVFNIVALVTGSIWGKPTWGTWWVWDARLTSVFILFLIYMGHIAVVRAFEDEYKGARAAAILTLFGAFNLPIIKFSVDWWNTLHQPASVIKLDGPSIHVDMLIPLILMAFGFLFFYFSFLLINVQTELNQNLFHKRFDVLLF